MQVNLLLKRGCDTPDSIAILASRHYRVQQSDCDFVAVFPTYSQDYRLIRHGCVAGVYRIRHVQFNRVVLSLLCECGITVSQFRAGGRWREDKGETNYKIYSTPIMYFLG